MELNIKTTRTNKKIINKKKSYFFLACLSQVAQIKRVHLIKLCLFINVFFFRSVNIFFPTYKFEKKLFESGSRPDVRPQPVCTR